MRRPLNATRWSYMGGVGGEPDLVLRVDAFMPWRGATEWRIEKRGRERMHGALPGSELSRVLMELAARRGLTQPQPPWTFVPEQEGGRQSERGAQYRCALLAPDATLAPLTAEARLILPNGFQHQSVQASAEIRVGFASLKATADTSADLRLSVG